MSGGKVTDLTKGIVGDSDWIRRWQAGETGWHHETADPYLVKNGNSLFGDEKKRIFVPLCGKSFDLLWFYEHGHTVVGVELFEQAIKEHLDDNKIDYSVEEVEQIGKIFRKQRAYGEKNAFSENTCCMCIPCDLIYLGPNKRGLVTYIQSTDGRLEIFAASIFNIPIEKLGKYDAIWDVRSLTAINLEDHIRYRDLMCALALPGAVSYLRTLEYDESVWPGPPHSTSSDTVKRLFGDAFIIELKEEIASKPNAAESAGSESQSSNCEKEQTKEVEKPTEKMEEPKALTSAGAAIKTSSYRFDRTYKLVFK